MALISRQRQFVFVHIQKTGGRTIERLLRQHVPDAQPLGRAAHIPWRAIAGRLDRPEQYIVFAFVRNPWERLVSWYTMIHEAFALGLPDALKSRRNLHHFLYARYNPLWRDVHRHAPTFDEFVRKCRRQIEVKPGIHYSCGYPQSDYLKAADDTFRADFVGRIEHFAGDVAALGHRLGVDFDTIPHENRSLHAHYADYYTPQTQAIVRDVFREDIERFGYAFNASDASSPSSAQP
ncbi:MAG: sulfotransferase family 2 domain-containing protein [Phycisphaerae bacterium]|jgi:hypothetical protein|nr:sulfotransferase family 2 domain-containing protein [Phycisphaerae bacterium]